MDINWIKDKHGNRVAFVTIQGRKAVVRAYTNGLYEALCILGQSVFGRVSTTTYFSGKEATMLQAQKVCEEKVEELNKVVEEPEVEEVVVSGAFAAPEDLPVVAPKIICEPIITIEDGVCTIIVPENAEVKYTTNGKDVKKSNKVYKEPFEVAEGTVVKAVAYFADGTISEQVEA